MSNILNNAEQGCDSHEQPSSAIEVIIEPRDSDLGGFYVHRALPTRQKRMVGPWIFFDEMGPADFPQGEGVNVAPHPHIGLSTVTYLFDGEMLHRDSIGSYQIITPGDINLMVAGKGVTHSERERPEITAREHRLHGLQLWLALPEQYEQTEPAFYHIPSTDIPSAKVNGGSVRVMIGEAYGVKSPVPTLSETLYLEAKLDSGQELTLPTTEELAVYIVSGRLNSEGKELAARTLVVLKTEEQPVITAQEPSHIVIIGGNTLGNRFINWNFVSSNKELIEQARMRTFVWHEGQLRAEVGQYQRAISLMKQARKSPEKDMSGWNYYVDATIAFLQSDREKLKNQREKLAEVPKPEGFNPTDADGNPIEIQWPPNLNIVDKFIRCFDQPYSEVYTECTAEK